jgi:hypothetical protein
LHCHHDLGRNEAIEEFPIGRRLAFDAAKGRLWVICPSCARWNLTPIEERWEAVESCERLFRGERLRSQTDNIGLTRIREGTELIRIGNPLRPEFAAWRYGAVFERRRTRRTVAITAGGAVFGTTLALAGVGLANTLALSVAPAIAVLPLIHTTVIGVLARANVRRLTVAGEMGKALHVTHANLNHTTLAIDDDGQWRLKLRHELGRQELTGERATRAVASILARANSGGGRTSTVKDAVGFITEAGDPERAIHDIARESQRRIGDFEEIAAAVRRGARGKTIGEVIRAQAKLGARGINVKNGIEPKNKGAIHNLPAPLRLALEMSLHESSEQHALEEELSTLEQAWREAEEIAAIADGLLTGGKE